MSPPGGVRDPLYAKALVLDDEATRVAIIAVDTTAIGGRKISANALPDVGEQFLPELRSLLEAELSIPGAHVLVNASHTHPRGPLLCDDEAQVGRTFEAVRQAVAGLTEVRVGAGAGHEDRLTINRDLRLKDGRDWTIRHSHPCPPDSEVAGLGPTDPEIGILRVDRLDGRPLAVLYNFACHPLFGDIQGALTANFPGVASRVIEQTVGHGAMALFLQGAGGSVCDLLFKDFTRPRDMEPMGVALGLSTLSAWRGIEVRDADLGVLSETLELPRRTDIPQRVAKLTEEREGLLEALRGTTLSFRSFLPLYLQHALHPEHPSDYSYRYLHDEMIGSAEQAAMDGLTRRLVDKYLASVNAMERLAVIQDDIATLRKHQQINDEAGSPTVPSEVQGIRIGDAVIVTSPAELLVEVGLALKQASPFTHTLVAAFSNGYLHYGAPADAYDRGGYEVVECLLAPGWERLYREKATDIMRRLHVL
jgi:hypothetical protein